MNESHDHVTSHALSIPPLVTAAADNVESDHSESRACDVQVGVNHRNDNLSQFRRGLTLRKNALQRPTCTCTRDCHCMPQADGLPSSDLGLGDAPSTRIRDPISVDEVPSEPVVDRLTGERFLGFSYLGSHLDHQAQPTSHGTDSPVASGQSAPLRQAPTLGPDSSVSLRPP